MAPVGRAFKVITEQGHPSHKSKQRPTQEESCVLNEGRRVDIFLRTLRDCLNRFVQEGNPSRPLWCPMEVSVTIVKKTGLLNQCAGDGEACTA